MKSDYIVTSESVTIGHPDKLCDQVSDAIVDHFLMHDPDSRIIAECAVSSGVMFISAHYASQAKVDISNIARKVIRNIDYPKDVFDADACTIMTSFVDHTATDYLSYDLDNMDDAAIDKIPVRQQASVFGYACDQTPALMPLPIWLAHRLADRLDSPKVADKLPWLLPDGEWLLLACRGVGQNPVSVMKFMGLRLSGSLLIGFAMSKANELAKALFGFKELFLVGFFLTVGMTAVPGWIEVLVALLFILLLPIKVAMYFGLFNLFCLRASTSWRTSLNLANYSEFGLIVGALAASAGWLPKELLAVFAVMISISFIPTFSLSFRSPRRKLPRLSLSIWSAI